MTQGERILLDDEGNAIAKDGDLVYWFRCINCDESIATKVVYTTQNVVCPHCKKKFKVRLYKKGTIRISVR